MLIQIPVSDQLRRWLFSIAIVFLVQGCASYKPYPVCFFDSSPPSAEAQLNLTRNLLVELQKIDKDANMIANGRWIVASTTPFQHKQLIEYWPRIACIGTVTSGTEVKSNSDCVTYLNRVVTSQNYLEFDVKSPYALSDEAPGNPKVICSTLFE